MEQFLTRIEEIKMIEEEFLREIAISGFVDRIDRAYLDGKITKKEYNVIYKKLSKI